jgi:peptidoglycan/xylan/chitin deacetylase (PgdA/CDA1 family)
MRCERVFLAAKHPSRSSRSRILSYHGVGTPEWGVTNVTPSRFRRHLDLALEAGYQFVPARDVAGAIQDGDRRLAITFDDGLRTVATNAAPILADYGIPWTMFIVTKWADGEHPIHPDLFLGWDEIERLIHSGATIGSHSMTHPDFGRLARGAAEHELVSSRDAIRQHTGVDTTEFAIPTGRSVNWTPSAGEAARDAGYVLVYAHSERLRLPGTVPRTFITRFDGDRLFRAALGGAFDGWEEWI